MKDKKLFSQQRSILFELLQKLIAAMPEKRRKKQSVSRYNVTFPARRQFASVELQADQDLYVVISRKIIL